MAKINITKVLTIVLGSLCLGIAYNYFSPAGVPIFGFNIKKYVSAELLKGDISNLPADEPKHISLKEALKLYEADVTFIDAREGEDYLNGHIKEAINIPYSGFEKFRKKLNNVPKDEPLVIYCGGSDCDLSIMLGNKLASLGYSKVFIFFGGWNSWTEAKYPTSK